MIRLLHSITVRFSILCAGLLMVISTAAQIPSAPQDFIAFHEGDLFAWDAGQNPTPQALTDWDFNGGPILAPTGEYIAYLSVPTAVAEPQFYPQYAVSTPQNIWIMNTRNRDFQRIAGSDNNTSVMRGQPVWSPDGNRLLWAEYVLNSDITRAQLVVYDRRNNQTTTVLQNMPLGFQDGGISLPIFQWSSAGVSRILFTYLESGDGVTLLEIYNAANFNAAPVSVVLGNTTGTAGALAFDHIWVEHQSQQRIAILDIAGNWSLVDPVQGTRAALAQAPSMVLASNPSALALIPRYVSTANGWEIQWQLTVGSTTTSLDIRGSRFSSNAAPAIAPSGDSLAWYDVAINGIRWQPLNGQPATAILSSDEPYTAPVYPRNVVGAPVRWMTTVPAGQPIPSPVPPNNDTARCDQPARLSQGQLVYVDAGEPNNVRATPDLNGTFIGSLPAGSVVQLTEGPVCEDGIYWWRISNETINGWTAEGRGSQLWLKTYTRSASQCETAPAPRLMYPDTAYVLPGDPNILRSAPGTGADSQRISSIPAGARVSIVGTAICAADGRRWYPVRYNNRYGWTAEGENNTYWLAPVNR